MQLGWVTDWQAGREHKLKPRQIDGDFEQGQQGRWGGWLVDKQAEPRHN